MTKTIISRLFVSIILALGATALSAQTHWSYTGTYQNDMRIFFELKNGAGSVDLDDYEVAAFIGDECRGVATKEFQVVSAEQTIYYGRLQLWGAAADEAKKITFKAFDKTTNQELGITTETDITFSDNSQLGTLSSLVPFKLLRKGDVNDDGDVDIADAVCIVNHIVGKPNTNFVMEAADVNNDKAVDIADAVRIVNFVVGKINALAPKFGLTLPIPE